MARTKSNGNASDWFRQNEDVRCFSLSASNGERAGVRCRSCLPPKGNADFAWVQHFISTQSRTLTILRDTLLPKLLNGELATSGPKGTINLWPKRH